MMHSRQLLHILVFSPYKTTMQRVLNIFCILLLTASAYSQHQLPPLEDRSVKSIDSILPYSMEYSRWDMDSNKWDILNRYDYLYNMNSDLTDQYEYRWYEGGWEPQRWVNHVYLDSALTETSAQLWDFYYEEWYGEKRYTYSYYNGKISQRFIELWDDFHNEWDNDSMFTYSYNANMQLTESIESFYYNAFSSWVNIWRNAYIYSTDSTIQEKMVYDWDRDQLQWMEHWKVSYTYNIDGNCDSELWMIQPDTAEIWIDDWFVEYTYDQMGNLTEVTVSEWFPGFDIWVGYSRVRYTYDTAGRLISTNTYWFDHDQMLWINELQTSKTYTTDGYHLYTIVKVWSNNTWNSHEFFKFFYSPSSDISELDDELTFEVFPNPTKDELHISFPRLSKVERIYIFDNLGKAYHDLIVSNNDQHEIINLASLPRGVYFVIIESNGGLYSRKVVLY